MRWLLILVLIGPGTAVADEPVQHKTNEELYPRMKGVEYYCTDKEGRRAELGQVSCLTASCQTWTARCEMSANNNLAIWRKLQDGCPGVSLERRLERLQPGRGAGAVHTPV